MLLTKDDWLRPKAERCFGRSGLLDAVIRATADRGCCLLFGSRQSGKTTVLLRIRRDLRGASADAERLTTIVVPVYTNLLTLTYDAMPHDFYRLLAVRARDACGEQIDEYHAPRLVLERKRISADPAIFVSDIEKIRDGARNADVRIMFLLDEASRVLGQRFPRGFQDNLFSILYGAEGSLGQYAWMVFAGTQDLYRFCEDDTSPLGSRAAVHSLRNLSVTAVRDLAQHLGSWSDAEVGTVAEWVYEQTGGQAGLTTRLLRHLASKGLGREPLTASIADGFSPVNHELFKLWAISLSAEARCVHDYLSRHSELSRIEIAKYLKVKGFDPLLADRVIGELQFSGMVKSENAHVAKINRMYWHYVDDLVNEHGEEQAIDYRTAIDQNEVWLLIERLELGLRVLLRRIYLPLGDERMSNLVFDTLGSQAEAQIKRMMANANSRYRFSPSAAAVDVLDFLYLGQLGQLIVARRSWKDFHHMFRDKRELEDMLAAITPVRNDCAHFRTVPSRELQRCRLCCEDLLAILEQEETGYLTVASGPHPA